MLDFCISGGIYASPLNVKSMNVAQQKEKVIHQIKGQVKDLKGDPIIGASIRVKGSAKGTVTDLDGNYVLTDVPTDGILEISYVGFLTQQFNAAKANGSSVILKEDNNLLDEVVSIGYGTQKKVTLTGSVSNLQGGEIVKSPAANIGASLEGRMTGLVVNQRSGEPGRDDPNIVIRGFGTLGNTSPLIIIDGVERDNLTRLNPEDIENITVLKDASAAIYGARAANGVILVTTKRGKWVNLNSVSMLM